MKRIPCDPPSGSKIDCDEQAIWYLSFTAGSASGGWYVCDTCCVAVMMWLEDQSYYDNLAIARREPAGL